MSFVNSEPGAGRGPMGPAGPAGTAGLGTSGPPIFLFFDGVASTDTDAQSGKFRCASGASFMWKSIKVVAAQAGADDVEITIQDDVFGGSPTKSMVVTLAGGSTVSAEVVGTDEWTNGETWYAKVTDTDTGADPASNISVEIQTEPVAP